MKNKAAQVYGYVVCIIAVITFLIGIATLINSLMDIGKPLYAGYRNDINLASFENFKADVMKELTKDAANIPTDVDLNNMYVAAREEVIARQSHRTRKNVIVNTVLIIVSIVLFFVHWKWMVRINKRMAEYAEGKPTKRPLEVIEN
jgi:predicted PurR-regulated permease PerM